MLMIANLPCCACAVNVTAKASTGHTNSFFTMKLLNSKIILFYPIRLQKVRPTVKRNMAERSTLYGRTAPMELIALLYVAVFGKYDLSATMGACRVPSKRLGL